MRARRFSRLLCLKNPEFKSIKRFRSVFLDRLPAAMPQFLYWVTAFMEDRRLIVSNPCCDRASAHGLGAALGARAVKGRLHGRRRPWSLANVSAPIRGLKAETARSLPGRRAAPFSGSILEQSAQNCYNTRNSAGQDRCGRIFYAVTQRFSAAFS